MIVGLYLALVASLGLAYLGMHIGAATTDVMALAADPVSALASGVDHMLSSPAPTLAGLSPMLALLLGVLPWCAYLWALSFIGRNERQGEQHGSANWARRSEMVRFMTEKNPDPRRNSILLTEHYGLAISRTGYSQRYDRNPNVIVIGGSGSGKTRYYVKPNVAQMASDFVITDPKGTLLPDVGQMLVDNGYDVLAFNTNVTELSRTYNPFAYVKSDLDIVEFVDAFMSMTSDQRKTGGDQFWDDSTKLLLISLIALMRDWFRPQDYHMGTLLLLLEQAKCKEEDESYESPLDIIFRQIETGTIPCATRAAARKYAAASGGARKVRIPVTEATITYKPTKLVNSRTGICPYNNVRKDASGRKVRGIPPEQDFALSSYKKFKTAAGKTLKSIIISVNVRFNAIRTDEVRRLLSGADEMHLDRLGGDRDGKVRPIAIFDTFKDTNQQTLGFLHGLLIWQCVNVACKRADRDFGGKLPRFTNLILDEFKSLNLPKSIADMISVIRSRNVGMSIILQSNEQLYQMYDEHCANGIVGCCDTMLYLGGGDNATNKMLSDAVGQQTVDQTTYSSSHGGSGGYTKQQNTLGRALIDPAEVGKIERDEALLIIKGTQPAKDKKYPLERHPNYALMDPGHKGARYERPFSLSEYMADHPEPAPVAGKDAAAASVGPGHRAVAGEAR